MLVCTHSLARWIIRPRRSCRLTAPTKRPSRPFFGGGIDTWVTYRPMPGVFPDYPAPVKGASEEQPAAASGYKGR
jgi:hypothetical protein